jgi:hypothetical protein
MTFGIRILAVLLVLNACDGGRPAQSTKPDVASRVLDSSLGDRSTLDFSQDIVGPDGRTRPCVPGTNVAPLPDECTKTYCHQILRFDYLTLAPKGFATLGGDLAPVDNETAKQAAEQYLHGKMKPSCPACTFPVDLWKSSARTHLFGVSPVDFGSFAMVSSDTGQIVAAGSIWWMGLGEWWSPTTWKPGTQIRCGNSLVPNKSTAEFGQCGGSPFSFNDAINVALKTNIALGLDNSGPLDVLAYLYTPATGSCQSEHAEFVVVLSYQRK